MNSSFLKSNTFIFLILGLIVFAVFGNALFNEFSYDDHYLILDNPYIKDLTHFNEFLLSDVAMTTPIGRQSGYYRPVSMIFLLLNYHLWGMNSFGLHLMSIIIHLLNCFFVFLIIKRISKNFWISLLSASIFSVHPIHVEAVAPVFNYMGLLSSFFALFSFWAFLKSNALKDMRYVILSVSLFFLSVFSKEEAIVLPAIFVLYDFYFWSNYSFKNLFQKWKKYLLLIFPSIFYIVLRFLVFGQETAFGFWRMRFEFNVPASDTIIDQVMMTAYIFFKYFSLLVVPTNLTAYYLIKPVSELAPFQIFVSIFVVFFVVGYGIMLAKKSPIVSFFIGWFFISSIMISNIIPIGGLFSERFMYFPSVAYCFLVGFLFYKIYKIWNKTNDRRKRLLFILGFLVVFSLYAQKSAARNYVWRNDITLWKDAIKKTPQSYRPYLNLAGSYHFYGEQYHDLALKHYLKALEYSDVPRVRVENSIGRFYGVRNQHKKALKHFLSALEVESSDIKTLYNIGITYYFLGNDHLAEKYLKDVNRVDKDYPWGYYGLGMVYQRKGQKKRAKKFFEKTLEVEPNLENARSALELLKDG